MNWIKILLTMILYPPLLGSLYYLYVSHQSDVQFNHGVWGIFIVFAYWLTILVGLPLVLTLRKQGIVSLKSHLVFGWGGCVSVFVLLCILSNVTPPIVEVLMFSVFGIISGFISWYIH